MKRLYLSVAMIFSMLQITACGDSDGVSPAPGELTESIPGMEKISAGFGNVVLGTNDVAAKADERPQMNVVFNYDFLFGIHGFTLFFID